MNIRRKEGPELPIPEAPHLAPQARQIASVRELDTSKQPDRFCVYGHAKPIVDCDLIAAEE